MTRLDSASVPTGAVVPLDVDRTEFVVWRGTSGVLGNAPRICPHLDWDLADAIVVDDELVCSGHGWSFDCNGHAFKRTELGRIDRKDDVETLRLVESEGTITAAR